MYKLSPHASQERIERLMYLNLHIGIGNEVCSMRGLVPDRREVLTDTGVMLILSDEDVVITAYLATMRQAMRVWRSNYDNMRMPNRLYRKVIENRKAYENVKEIDHLFGYHEKENYNYFSKKP